MRVYCKTCRKHRGHREVDGQLVCWVCVPEPRVKPSPALAALMASLGGTNGMMPTDYWYENVRALPGGGE